MYSPHAPFYPAPFLPPSYPPIITTTTAAQATPATPAVPRRLGVLPTGACPSLLCGGLCPRGAACPNCHCPADASASPGASRWLLRRNLRPSLHQGTAQKPTADWSFVNPATSSLWTANHVRKAFANGRPLPKLKFCCDQAPVPTELLEHIAHSVPQTPATGPDLPPLPRAPGGKLPADASALERKARRSHGCLRRLLRRT